MSWDDLTDGVMRTCVDTFDHSTTLQPILYKKKSTGAEKQIQGVFDKVYSDVILDGQPVSTLKITLGIHKADVEPERDDTVTVRGIGYRVVDFEPDGESGIKINLSELTPEDPEDEA